MRRGLLHVSVPDTGPWFFVSTCARGIPTRSRAADTYATPAQAQAEIFAASQLASGSHSLDIEVTGARNPVSGGSWVWVDAFGASARYEQDDPAASYRGTWSQNTLPLHSGGSAVLSMDPGAAVSFSFAGDAVSWLGYQDPWSGIARVSIDGRVRAEIDTYAAAAGAQRIAYTLSGLGPGPHVVTIEPTGRRHPLSLGIWIWVDAFETPAGSGP